MKLYSVLYVTHEARMLGANHSLLNLIDGLKGRVIPYVLLPEYGALAEELEKRQIRYFVLNYRNFGLWNVGESIIEKFSFHLKHIYYSFLNSHYLKRLIKILARLDIDIVHSNTSIVTIGRSIARKLSCKHVWHIREFQDIDHGFRMFYSKSKFISILRKTDAIICITKAVAKHFELEDKALVIYNGVRSEVKSFPTHPRDYFVFCGFIKKEKGIEEAIQAFSRVVHSNPNAKLKIVGDSKPDYKVHLLAMITGLSLSSNIEFLGFTRDVDVIIGNARALLMCSVNEAMGRVTAEAMLLGCPVVGLNSQGTGELIVHGETGLLYTSTDELAEYLITLLNDDSLVERLALSAMKFAESQFLESKYAQRVYQCYESLQVSNV